MSEVGDFVSIKRPDEILQIYVISKIEDNEIYLHELTNPEDIEILIQHNNEWIIKDDDVREENAIGPYKIDFLGPDVITPYDIRNVIMKQLEPIESDPNLDFKKFTPYHISSARCASPLSNLTPSEGSGKHPTSEYGFKLIIEAKTYEGAVLTYKDWLGRKQEEKLRKGKNVSNPSDLWENLDIYDFIGDDVKWWPSDLDDGMDLLIELNAGEVITYPSGDLVKSATKK